MGSTNQITQNSSDILVLGNIYPEEFLDLKIDYHNVVFISSDNLDPEDTCLTNYRTIIMIPPLHYSNTDEEVVVIEREILRALDEGTHVCILINDIDENEALVNNTTHFSLMHTSVRPYISIQNLIYRTNCLLCR